MAPFWVKNQPSRWSGKGKRKVPMQAILPLLPEGSTPITQTLSVCRREGKWYYFCGIEPVFHHAEADRKTFQMYTSQLVETGECRQSDIVRAFGVSASSVKRAVKLYRQGGVKAFYEARKGRGASVLTTEVRACVQELLDSGISRCEVARELGFKPDTLRKAIEQGRLHEPARIGDSRETEVSDKSQRSEADADAASGMGTACTRVVERTLAAFGKLAGGARTWFDRSRDVSMGGLLCALPALAANGLYSHLGEFFRLPKGYYTIAQVLTLLAFMALARIRTAERLRYESPGELGKLLGLDRIPEVRCLRGKLAVLCVGDAAEQWSARLSREWLETDPEKAGTLYVDGHVRVYHGNLTKLPRRYISRERLCLRGTTDYWVNDMLGQPFFVINRAVDEGLLKALREEIVPRLLRDVPHQPSEEMLKASRYLHRFLLVFDREGYSPRFFKEMWERHRIGCLTYHKYPDAAWPEEEFVEKELTMPNGERVRMKLAERGSLVGNGAEALWVREVRKLTKHGHQTSLLSTAYSQFSVQDAGLMFSRWAQENFFGYMMEHFALDLLGEYGTVEIPGPQSVVNPPWRLLDGRQRSLKGQLARRQAEFGALTLHPQLEAEAYHQWEKQKTELAESILMLENQLAETKQQCKTTPKRIALEKLPASEQFQQLAPSRKHLLDTVKMISYRSETAMATILREHLGRRDDARALLRDLYRSDADLLPDLEKHLLNVRIHHMANPQADRAIHILLEHLNEAEFNYPGTDMKMVYALGEAAPSKSGPSHFPAGKEI